MITHAPTTHMTHTAAGATPHVIMPAYADLQLCKLQNRPLGEKDGSASRALASLTMS
ncbi:unnamed protein product [Ectocarpus sp. CCAP 1310/34]|nr:unnamed protein product [Ectocarpus sp. CCAP 1310/34]